MTTASAKYFASADGKQLGPFTGRQIRTKLFRKTITPDDYVWRDGLGDQWVPIRSILDELPSDVAPPPAPETPELRHIEITHPDGSPSTLVEVPEKVFTNHRQRLSKRIVRLRRMIRPAGTFWLLPAGF